MPILTRIFGSVNYGIWAQVAVLANALGPIIVLGTDSATIRYLPGQDKETIRRGIGTNLAYFAAVSALAALLLARFSVPLSTALFEEAENARYVVLIGGVIFANMLLNVCRVFYRVVDNAKVFSVISITQSITGTVISVGVVLLKGGIFELVLAQVVTDLVLDIVLLSHIALTFGIGRPELRVLGKFVRFGLPLVPAGYAMWGLNQADRFFVVHYHSLSDLGVYSVVYHLGYMFITMIYAPIWTMYGRTAAEFYNRGDLDGLNRLFRLSTRLALGLLVPAMVGMGVLGVPLMHLLAGQEFVRGAPLIPIITLAYVFHMIASYFAVSMGLAHKQYFSTLNIGVAVLVNLVLNYVLIPKFNITGAAIATMVSFGVQLLLNAIIGSRFVPLRFDWAALGKSILASLGMAAVLVLLPMPPGQFWVLLWGLLGMVAYAVLALALRLIRPEEVERVICGTSFQRVIEIPWVRLLVGLPQRST